jgi:hypothetical protein
LKNGRRAGGRFFGAGLVFNRPFPESARSMSQAKPTARLYEAQNVS